MGAGNRMERAIMKAILIDPSKRSLEYVETPANLLDVHQLIGCDCLDAAYPFGPREAVFVDDTGAIQDNPPLPHFRISGHFWPLYGRALILGITPGGASRSTRLTVEEVRERIIWAA
jgi:hypothetical protein